MKERTDPHRPSVADPADYEFVGAADDHPGDSYMEIRHDVLARHGVETGSSDRYSAVNVPFYDAQEDGRPNFRCHHCGKHGSNIRYFCFFLHKPSKQVIVVGQICAKKLSLASREEIDFQKRADSFRTMRDRRGWVEQYPQEFEYLKRYDERHRAGGFYSEFLSSLWSQLQEKGSLTMPQVEALQLNIARLEHHRREREGQVIHTEAEPTEKQIALIEKLATELGEAPPLYTTRQQAAEVIDKLFEARAAADSKAGVHLMEASSKQISFINRLMDERKLDLSARREARQMLDNGLSKEQASKWIERLLDLPKVEA